MKKITNKEIKQKFLNYVASNKGTTFVELEKMFDRLGFDYKGEYEITLNHENHVLWVGWDIELFNLISELRTDGLIEFNATHPMTYYIDGKIPNLPVTTTSRKKKKPHWIPITIGLTEKAKNSDMTVFDALDVVIGRGVQ